MKKLINETQEKTLELLSRYWNDQRAVTAIEYGVLAASIAIGIGALFAGDGEFMTALQDTFGKITEQLKSSTQ